MSLEAKKTLIFAVLKFLKSEINAETTTADVKESLEGIYFALIIILDLWNFIFFSSCITMFRIML